MAELDVMHAPAKAGVVRGVVGVGVVQAAIAVIARMRQPIEVVVPVGPAVVGAPGVHDHADAAAGTLAVLAEALTPAFRLAAADLFSLIGGAVPAAIFARVPHPRIAETEQPAVVGLITQAAGSRRLIGPPAMALAVGVTGGWTGAPLYTLSCAIVCLLAALFATSGSARAGVGGSRQAGGSWTRRRCLL